MKFNKNLIVIFVSFLVFGFTAPISIFAASPLIVDLKTAGNFVVLSKVKITTTGTTAITGDIGVSPSAATYMEGFSLVADPSNKFSTSTYVDGKVYAADYADPTPAYMGTAIIDMEAAYVDAAGRTPLTEPLDSRTGTLPLGTTFTTGIYKWSTGVNITGDITLSGSASDVWIFQIAGNLDISANKKVILSGGAQASNIFWAVAGTTTLEPGSNFAGNILAGPGVSTIAMQSLATLDGRALGQKDVTLIASNISITSATLNVVKHVVNDNGGAATADDWNLAVTSSNDGSGVGSAPGLESGTAYKLQVGKDYSISESGGPSGYTSSSSDCTITNVVANATYNCTITNDDNAAHLIVIKHVINDSGGLLNASNFTTTITGVNTATHTTGGVESPGIDNILTSVGAYSINEGAHAGYKKTLSTGCSGTIALGETKTCTITNNDIAPDKAVLDVIKHVINDNGGSASASNFNINVTGTNVSDSSFTGLEDPGTEITLDAGAYSVDEGAYAGYTKTLSTDCSGTIASGDTKTCTITNDDNAAHLIVIKHVINDSGGLLNASNFTTTITGVTTTTPTTGGFESPGIDNILTSVGAYSIDEGAHVGYKKTLSTDCSGTIALGETKTCTITNNDIAPDKAVLDVIKHVINDNGGSANASNFNMNVTGTNVSDSSFTGLEDPGTEITLDAGAYSVDEGAYVGYTKTLSGDCSGTIASGETKTCTITNDDIPQSSSGVSGSGIVYGCKDTTANNYNFFSSSRPELCKYAIVASVVTPIVIVSKLPKTGFPPREEDMMWSIFTLTSISILVPSSFILIIKKYL